MEKPQTDRPKGVPRQKKRLGRKGSIPLKTRLGTKRPYLEKTNGKTANAVNHRSMNSLQRKGK